MPEKLILFSEPTPEVMAKLTPEIFGEFIKDKVLAYMPSDGGATEANAKYTPFWQEFAQSNGAQFINLDNSKTGNEAETEIQKLELANILVITGGNTFKLLKNLRDSGFDKAIKQFWQKNNVILVGFSAGAEVLTPSIKTASQGDKPDPNDVGLEDLSGLGLVDFEIWPHYNQAIEQKSADEYEAINHIELKRLANQDLLVINK